MKNRAAVALLALTLLTGGLWLSRVLFDRSGARPISSPRPVPEDRQQRDLDLRRSDASPARVEQVPESTALPEASGRASEEPAGIPADDPVQCMVYGRVHDLRGEPIDAPTRWVSFTDSLGQRQNTEAGDDGAYAITGLEPGDWWVRVGFRGYRSPERELQLTLDQPVVRLDFALEPSVVIKVRLVTSEGMPSMDAIREELKGVGHVVPVATREAPGDLFTEIRGSLNNRFGVGSFWQNGYYFEPLPPEYYGVIEIGGISPSTSAWSTTTASSKRNASSPARMSSLSSWIPRPSGRVRLRFACASSTTKRARP